MISWTTAYSSIIYLGKHRLPMQGGNDTLITVHSYTCVVKGFFGMSQLIPQVRYTTLEDASKVPRDKRATNTYGNHMKSVEECHQFASYCSV